MATNKTNIMDNNKGLVIRINDDNGFIIGVGEVKKCSSCKKQKEIFFQYSPNKIDRDICADCFHSILDKVFNIKNHNTEMESVLYKKN